MTRYAAPAATAHTARAPRYLLRAAGRVLCGGLAVRRSVGYLLAVPVLAAAAAVEALVRAVSR